MKRCCLRAVVSATLTATLLVGHAQPSSAAAQNEPTPFSETDDINGLSAEQALGPLQLLFSVISPPSTVTPTNEDAIGFSEDQSALGALQLLFSLISQAPTYGPTQPPTTPPNNEDDVGFSEDQSALGALQLLFSLISQAPTFGPTQSPTTTPAISPRTKRLATGKTCSRNAECLSKTCRNGACMASSSCYPIRHEKGTPFDANKINMVFVGSGFDTASRETWRTEVENAYSSFDDFKMLASNVQQLNLFRVDPDEHSESFCHYSCRGIDRLLCCDLEEASRLSSLCFPTGAHRQTLVIHNNNKRGGGGYGWANVAVVSTHPVGKQMIVHELGHSLFELADEYSNGDGDDDDPNCSSSGCSKWSDLIENTPTGYKQVKCEPGCSSDRFFTAGDSIMSFFGHPVGAVNERLSCCTYRALCGSVPSYCEAFEFEPNYLLNYCMNNDYQGYGASMYSKKPAMHIMASSISSTHDVSKMPKYVFVDDPLLVKIRLGKNGRAVTKEPIPLPPGYFRKEQVYGDFSSAKEAAKLDVASLLKVRVFTSTGRETFFHSLDIKVDVPRLNGEGEEQNAPRSVLQKLQVVEMIVDRKAKKFRRIRAKVITALATPN